ncbi:MAG TPA: hypothetical protein VKM94_03970 [Blastocatellia bacterium]|nr:hypothetical protein [Blastocatellia bacterium]
MTDETARIGCRQVRKLFPEILAGPKTDGTGLVTHDPADGIASALRHLESCSTCDLEYRLFGLSRATLNAAACPEDIEPDREFFKALRARIARGPAGVTVEPRDEWWTAALLAARQLIPAMTVLLLLIIGATLLWNSGHPRQQVAARQEAYEIQEPSPDDVLDSVAAVEDRKDGR